MCKIDWKYLVILLIDLLIILFSYVFASIVVENFQITQSEILEILKKMYIILPVFILYAVIFKLDNSIWRYASIEEALKVFLVCLGSYVTLVFINNMNRFTDQYNTLFLATVFAFVLLTGARFSYRTYRIYVYHYHQKQDLKRTLIIGAGQAGSLLLKEIKNNPTFKNKIIGLIDDDPKKINKYINHIKVLGKVEDLGKYVQRYNIEEIIIAIPSASKEKIMRIINQCEHYKVKIKLLPPFYEMMNQNVSATSVRDVQIEDLLGREPVEIDSEGLADFLQGQVVLVTGAGGSIGSELCRQIVNYQPKRLIMVDIYENSLYDIQNELKRKHPSCELLTLIASVRDYFRLEEIFETYRPSIVFHAAAHKHVPLMEDSPKEAIKNNIFGTHNVVKLSDQFKVKKFVLISTDKAVNPTNIMGSTKRFAEMIIEAYSHESETQFAAVRFGNVLGSNGSVIPLFKKQIEAGGPVTVTHKDIIRYFMTIPEAVQLVLQAGAFAKGGEIFVLDMGEPVKILDLAERLIRLSGYEPYKTMQIEFTGLRPGEKLYEELLMDTEGLTKTANKKIFVLKQVECDKKQILKKLDRLEEIVLSKNVDVQAVFNEFVNTYKQPKVG